MIYFLQLQIFSDSLTPWSLDQMSGGALDRNLKLKMGLIEAKVKQ